MTQLLERAFTEASKLPETEQDAVASLLLAELESERQWGHTFASSQDELAKLADEALREASLSEDWNRPEEDAAWSHLQQTR